MNVDQTRLKLAKSLAVFAPVVDEFHITDNERLNRELVAEIGRWSAADAGITRSNVSGWHSAGNIFERTELPIREICSLFVECCKPVFARYLTKDRLEGRKLNLEGWVNVNPPHAYNQMHTHDQFDVSGVYFVKIPQSSEKSSGLLQFVNPVYRGGPQSDLFNAMNPHFHNVEPEEGKMVIFPSAMPHWVLPNGSGEKRVSIAFNAKLRKEPA